MSQQPRPRRTRHVWTDEEIELLRAQYPHRLTADIAQALGLDVMQVYKKAQRLALAKAPAFVADVARERVLRNGCGSRFQKGHVPWCKGTKGLVGHHPNTRANHFQTGQRGNRYAPVGSLRIRSDGYLERKVSDTGYPPRDWRPVHRLVWEAAHGPIPPDHVVAFKPGCRTTQLELITLAALECMPRAEAARRNVIHALPPELRQVITLRGAITRQINKRLKEHAE